MGRSNVGPIVSRRDALQGLSVSFAAALAPRPSSAAGARDPRVVVIILRGALDGLTAVAPIGDPDYALLHGALALPATGDRAGLPLDGFFALHPAMPVFARMYKEKRALVAHAVATNYRDRSHFDGQDVLESGFPGPNRAESGWLNRAVALASGREWRAHAWAGCRSHRAAGDARSGARARMGAAGTAQRGRIAGHARH